MYVSMYVCLHTQIHIHMYVQILIYIRRPLVACWTLGRFNSKSGGGAMAATERGYPEPFGLPAQNPGCCCIVGQPYSSGAFFWFFRVFSRFSAQNLWTPLDPPAPPPHPSFFYLFLALFCPDCPQPLFCLDNPGQFGPRFMKQQGQRLRAGLACA